MTDQATPTEEQSIGDLASMASLMHHDYRSDQDYGYVVSHTGLAITLPNAHKPESTWVISFVNGSMCINPINEPVDATNFDEYLFEWLIRNCDKTGPGKGSHPWVRPTVIGIAYWDDATRTYGLRITPYPNEDQPEQPASD